MKKIVKTLMSVLCAAILVNGVTSCKGGSKAQSTEATDAVVDSTEVVVDSTAVEVATDTVVVTE